MKGECRHSCSRGQVYQRLLRLIASSGVVIALVFLTVSVALGAYVTKRVSTDPNGGEANGRSFHPSVSGDGRYIAFTSWASNLVVDTNDVQDVFVKDSAGGNIVRVSIGTNGAEGNAWSDEPEITDDGTLVVFASGASNLIQNPGDNNGVADIFLRDMTQGITERITEDANHGDVNGASSSPSISDDGRYVVFVSAATDLIGPNNDNNGVADVFRKDRQGGQIARLSTDSNGNEANGGNFSPEISDDGMFTAFASDATNLVANDNNGSRDIFVKDAQGNTTRVSTSALGEEGNGDSYEPSISADGRFVAFWSNASNLVPNDNNGQADVFVKDRSTGQVWRVSTDPNGGQANGWSGEPSISDNGRYVVFASGATNLVADNNNKYDIFVKDLGGGSIARISVDQQANEGNDHSDEMPSISGDACFAAFRSDATNLVANDNNGVGDVFKALTQACLGAPVLSLSEGSVYWESYSDYLSRSLSVDLKINNDGGGKAFSVLITGAVATNGVACSSSLPAVLGNIDAGANVTRVFKFNVPTGVGSYTVSLFGQAQDAAGSTYLYPQS